MKTTQEIFLLVTIGSVALILCLALARAPEALQDLITQEAHRVAGIVGAFFGLAVGWKTFDEWRKKRSEEKKLKREDRTE